MEAQRCSIAKGASASRLSTFAPENSISRSNVGKRQVFHTVQDSPQGPWLEDTTLLGTPACFSAAPAITCTHDVRDNSGAGRLAPTVIQNLQQGPFPLVKGSVAHRRTLEDTGWITSVLPCSAWHQHRWGHPSAALLSTPGPGQPVVGSAPSPHAPSYKQAVDPGSWVSSGRNGCNAGESSALAWR